MLLLGYRNVGIKHSLSCTGCIRNTIDSFSSDGKESAGSAGDLGSIPRLGRSPGEGNGCPLQYSGLENPMDCSLWGHKEWDTTERLALSTFTWAQNQALSFFNPQVTPKPIRVWEPMSPAETLTPTQTPQAQLHPWPRTSKIYPNSSHMPGSWISGHILPLTFQNLLF